MVKHRLRAATFVSLCAALMLSIGLAEAQPGPVPRPSPDCKDARCATASGDAPAPGSRMVKEGATASQQGATALTIGRWVAIATGAALVGTGIYYLSKDGDPLCRADEPAPCDRLRDTTIAGRVLIGAGAAIGAAGIIVPMLASSHDGTKLAGLLMSGRF